MKILVFAGSLRKDSLNKKFARISAHYLSTLPGIEVELVDLKDCQIPVYDGDVESGSGIPAGVAQLGEKIAAVDAMVISTPEYNGSIPGVLKNTIDWLSRLKPMPLKGKHLFLTAASPGALGGVRSLWVTRQPLENLGTFVFPDMMGLPKAHEQLTGEDHLVDAKLQSLLEGHLTHFCEFVKKALG